MESPAAASAATHDHGGHPPPPPPPPLPLQPQPPPQQHRRPVTTASTRIRIRSTPPVLCPVAAADLTAAGRHLPPQRAGHGDDGAPWAGVTGLHHPHSPTSTPVDPVQGFNTMAGSPMCTPPMYDEQLSAGSPSQRTPIVEVIMPQSISSRTRDSTVGSRLNRSRQARCAVGSPTLRIINRIQVSPRIRSPRSTTTQNSKGSRARSASRQLRSVYWKEFEPISINGEIVKAKCIHCHDYLSGKQNIGTSHLKKHLERCKMKSRVIELVDKMRAGSTSNNNDVLDNWIYDSDFARKALIRMIVLHELPFSIVEYDGFIEFVASLNPLFKLGSRTTVKLDCMKTFEDAKFELKEIFRSVVLSIQSSNELSAYLAESTIPRVEEFDILGWWKSNCATYPVLSRMACDVLATSATTVPSESAFSTGQRVVSDFRSRLSTETVEALICLQDWMRVPSPDLLTLQVVAPPSYKVLTNSDLTSDETTYQSELTSWA